MRVFCLDGSTQDPLQRAVFWSSSQAWAAILVGNPRLRVRRPSGRIHWTSQRRPFCVVYGETVAMGAPS